MREELVAKALALGSSAHQTGNVNELDCRRNNCLRLHDFRQRFQSVVGNGDDADIWFDRGEWIVGSQRGLLGCQSVEES